MNDYKLDLEKYATLARQAAAEGCVLLENEKQALPLREGESVAVFGRMAFHYYKSGLGSGGLVNTRYVVGILDALKECKEIQLDEKLLGIYTNWIKENPYDEGQGWGRVPWSQKEMEVTEEMLDCARSNDVSLVIIGRTAGEDQDNNTNPGSYCLTETEEDMIRRVCEVSKRTVVVLNVGNIIDMSWVEKYHPQAVLYAWQGGQEGGNGVADVLTGKVCACGKLTDTIAERIEYYPSTENFGDPYKNYYKEDIYVGYRYFETFAKDKVLYPFGYGLSYTNFETKAEIFKNTEDELTVAATVTNIGDVRGKGIQQPQEDAHVALCHAVGGHFIDSGHHGGDGGVDITAYKDELPPRILVQVKSQDGDIKESVLQSLKGALREGDYGTFVTLSNYTKNARKYLDNNPIIRGIDGSNLVDLILAHYERLSEKYQRMIPLEKVYIPVQSE